MRGMASRRGVGAFPREKLGRTSVATPTMRQKKKSNHGTVISTSKTQEGVCITV